MSHPGAAKVQPGCDAASLAAFQLVAARPARGVDFVALAGRAPQKKVAVRLRSFASCGAASLAAC